MKRVSALLTLACLLGACGYKGPLHLPGEKPGAKPAPAPSATPAATAEESKKK